LFRLQVLPRGFLFVDPVEIALVSRGAAHRVSFSPDLFTTGPFVKSPLPSEDIGFSGLRVLFPLNRAQVFDEALVFQGASYFRSLGANQGYGLSARGLAEKTGDPEGEVFPAFRAFWIEEPAPSSRTLVVHALLDSPSVAGAFRFTVRPGRTTIMEVEATLFPRKELSRVGLAPATSMFMFSPNGRLSADDFRPEVHDSDGLLVINGRGEHIWRPLANPAEIQVSSFLDKGPRGFGLMQRTRNLADYQDFEAHYERRPSLWIEPRGDWGEGAVVLTEIPSDAEIHDNIVAFWRPKLPIPANADFHYAYRLSWGECPKVALAGVRVLATRRGRADVRAPTVLRRFVVDYASTGDSGHEPPSAKASASVGDIKDLVVGRNPLSGGYRVAFVFDPKEATVSELRVDLEHKDRRRAETWMYRWTGP
jgi:glucans biosynthesis protein